MRPSVSPIGALIFVLVASAPGARADYFETQSILPSIAALGELNAETPTGTCTVEAAPLANRSACAKAICGDSKPKPEDSRCFPRNRVPKAASLAEFKRAFDAAVATHLDDVDTGTRGLIEFASSGTPFPDDRAAAAFAVMTGLFIGTNPSTGFEFAELTSPAATKALIKNTLGNLELTVTIGDRFRDFVLPEDKYWREVAGGGTARENFRTTALAMKGQTAAFEKNNLLSGFLTRAGIEYLKRLNPDAPTESDYRRLKLLRVLADWATALDKNPKLIAKLAAVAKRIGREIGEKRSAVKMWASRIQGMRSELSRSDEMWNRCEGLYRAAISEAMAPECVAAEKAKIEAAKKRYLDAVNGLLPPKEAAEVAAKLEKVDFALPPTANEIQSKFVHGMTDLTAYAEGSAKAPAYQKTMTFFAKFIDGFSTEELGSICYDLAPQPGLTDFFWSVDGRIRVSADAVVSGKLFSIVSHEFGHAFSTAIRSSSLDASTLDRMNEVRDCLAANHVRARTGDRELGNFFEEDFADLLAALMAPDAPNAACAFPDIENGSMTAVNDDVHSGEFFRLLHMETVRKGRLPFACLAAPEKNPFRQCWSPTPWSTPYRNALGLSF